MACAMGAQAADAEFAWPPLLKAKLDHIIKVQRDARITEPSPDVNKLLHAGMLRNDFNQSLLELGALPELQALLPGLPSREATDLRAKFALMAADFVKARDIYHLIGNRYVDGLHESREGNAAASDKTVPPGPVTISYFPATRPLKPEHLNERYRLAFEYHLLFPTRPLYLRGAWFRLGEALTLIGHPATGLTYIQLSSSCPWSIAQGPERLLDQVVFGFCQFPSAAALDALAELTERPDSPEHPSTNFRKAALRFIGGTWGNDALNAAILARGALNYQKWQAVVAGLPKDGKNPRRESLAKSIAALPPPSSRPASSDGAGKSP